MVRGERWRVRGGLVGWEDGRCGRLVDGADYVWFFSLSIKLQPPKNPNARRVFAFSFSRRPWSHHFPSTSCHQSLSSFPI